MTNPTDTNDLIERLKQWERIERGADLPRAPEDKRIADLLAEAVQAFRKVVEENSRLVDLAFPAKLADSFNEHGTPVTMFRCVKCEQTFTVCPAVPDAALDQWRGCLGARCSTYDPDRDAEALFDQGKVRRVGDRSGFECVALDAEEQAP